MSLNWQEIDLVLSELQLENCFIQKIKQPDFRTLVFDLFRPGEAFPLLFSLRDRAIRLHRTRHVPPNRAGSQRFAQLLRSHIRGGRITEVEHVNSDRVVRTAIVNGGTTYYLWFRLWGGKANILLTDSDHRILDAFLRRPQHGEATGAIFSPPRQPGAPPDPDRFPVRELPGRGDFNDRIDAFYYHAERQDRTDQLLRERIKQLQTKSAKLSKQQRDLAKAQHEGDRIDTYQEWGSLLLSSMHTLELSDATAHLNAYDGTPLRVPVDPSLSIPENANRYFAKAKKAKASVERTRERAEQVADELERVEQQIIALQESPEQLLDNQPHESRQRRKLPAHTPGLHFFSGECSIIVGRTASENDSLLRRYVKGNDWWLHTRDTPGGYVFVKPPPGKSVPLEVLLDAGNLAVWYSKSKSARKADLFYTQVKYLKRVKGGKRGLVIPTQEKNLSIQVEESRIERLMASS